MNARPPQVIGVSGPTGSGKTTIASYLKTSRYLYVIQEPLPINLLRSFSVNPSKYCYQLQLAFLEGRKQLDLQAHPMSRIVYDRTIEEDREVFFRLHFEQGFLTRMEYEDLCMRSRSIEEIIPCPQAILFLEATSLILTSRLKTDIIPTWIFKSIDRQLELYNSWIKGVSIPVIKFNTTDQSLAKSEQIASSIINTSLDRWSLIAQECNQLLSPSNLPTPFNADRRKKWIGNV